LDVKGMDCQEAGEKSTRGASFVFFTKYYYDDQIKEYVVARHKGSWGRQEIHTRFWMESMKG
jgi:hypothetical protein